MFVEVKARKNSNCGDPMEYIDSYKQKRIRHCALYFLKSVDFNQCDKDIRFDAIGITGFKNPKVEWIENAF